ncbi:MAG TPA: response regulator [Blastocatellia bacterium]|nr:response regulator [Blastocatellia bacterium]
MPIRILLVDDDEAFRSVTAIALESEGCVVDEANDGYTALAVLQHEHPDVVVCDLNMPGLDGRELCHRVRSNPRLADVRLVVLSALIEPDGSGIPPNLEADCCLSKQTHFSRLIAQLESLTRR